MSPTLQRYEPRKIAPASVQLVQEYMPIPRGESHIKVGRVTAEFQIANRHKQIEFDVDIRFRDDSTRTQISDPSKSRVENHMETRKKLSESVRCNDSHPRP